eukprot:TRINITY_DN16680_c0_g2_i5.p1 TRINITY_DN16680_c0_g2~~TRINITY_DN16680_c0_g2_i5.p1  ORF type:complete len:678 (+),score=89.34 TRINITY_DN16680_c0_g2_i5:94-2127(+)
MFFRGVSNLLSQYNYNQLLKKACQSSGTQVGRGSGSSRLARLLNTTEQDQSQQQQQQQQFNNRFQRGQQFQRGRQGNYGRGNLGRSNMLFSKNASKEVIGLQEQMNNDIDSSNPTQAIERFKKFVERAQIEAGQHGAMPQKYQLNTNSFELYFDAIRRSSRDPERIQLMTQGLQLLQEFDLKPNVQLFNQILSLLDTHAKGSEALNLLENQIQKIGEYDFYSYFFVISALQRSNQLVKAKKVLEQLHGTMQLIKANQIQDFRMLHFTLATKALQTGHYDVGVELINLIEEKISQLGGSIRNAPPQVFQPPPYLYANILGPAAEHDRVEIVMRALTRLGHQSVNIDGNAYPLKIDQGSLLSALNFSARQKDTHTAQLAFQQLQNGLERGYFLNERGTERKGDAKPHVAAFHALIHTYASVKNWTSTFDTMEQLQNIHPDEKFVSPFGALQDIVKFFSESTDVTDEVYFTLEQRLNNGKQVYPCMLNFVLSACAQCESKEPESSDLHPINRTFATFEEFSKFECAGNVDSFNCLIDVCRRFGKREVISSILDQMKKSDVQKNQTTFELIFMAFVSAKDLQGMLVVLNDMKRFNFTPSTKLLFHALEKCVDMGQPDMEREIRKELAVMGVSQLPVLQSKEQKQQQREKSQSQNQQRTRIDNRRQEQTQRYRSKGFSQQYG